MNTYGYVYQNPLKYTDPKGLFALPLAYPLIPPAAAAVGEACAVVGAAAWAGYQGIKALGGWGANNESSDDPSNNPHPTDPNPDRKPKQDKPLKEGGKEIDDLKNAGHDPHDLKPGAGYAI